MQPLTYQVPESVLISTKLPIIDEQGKTIFLMQKERHKFLASIVNATIRFGLPYSYKITNAYGKPLYSIDCAFPGIRYKITDHLSSQTIPIARHKVQLIEKAYSFKIANQDYYFEKDYTGTGHLKCNNKRIASVSMPLSTKISMVDTIKIESTTEEIAALAAVLFHTFYYYDA
ncbi:MULTISPECIES: hypothetical protein [unclassified Bacillus (in: firmicutes)]|uniref:tubby C-terminal domain-like protein n=1 Tax=unclassified Bacillus (in: firmicutes) TaxID=185979 RepID=UPI001BEA6586|nr:MULTISPECIES: hypothetical protein [unclassified Bacillus (in: firmicutes)]MBT2617227.1 hypothetical protein [Bacillus sp. ISL-78]MBT2627838.1 hypothetical protein [Bacillus sp. ISL-101]